MAGDGWYRSCSCVAIFPSWLHDCPVPLTRFLCFFVPCPSSGKGRGRVMLHRLWWSVNMSEYTPATGDTKISQTRIPEPALATKTANTHQRGGRRSIWHDTKCQLDYFLSCAGGFLYQFPNININISCSQVSLSAIRSGKLLTQSTGPGFEPLWEVHDSVVYPQSWFEPLVGEISPAWPDPVTQCEGWPVTRVHTSVSIQTGGRGWTPAQQKLVLRIHN